MRRIKVALSKISMSLLLKRVSYFRVASITLVVTIKGSPPAEVSAPEPAEYFPEARFLDATVVLVGQSGGMKNIKSSKS